MAASYTLPVSHLEKKKKHFRIYSTGLDVTSLAQAMETQALVVSLTFPKATGSTR